MKKHEGIYPIVKMSKALCVSKSGYYAWKHRPVSRRARERQELVEAIIEIQKRNKWRYGEKRITNALRKTRGPTGKNRVIRILSEENLGARRKKRFIATTNSKHNKDYSPNLLDRRFKVPQPNRVWVTDITYCRMRNRFLYLCVFIDLYSRTVVGWALRETMETSLVMQAFSMALSRRRPARGLMVHSDRGIQYCSDEFRTKLRQASCIQSMSRKGNCWDNAVAESFFKTLKTELMDEQEYETAQEMNLSLFGFLDGYYNRVRAHSALGYRTPLEFEQIGA
jgi:transposase InsO family protein